MIQISRILKLEDSRQKQKLFFVLSQISTLFLGFLIGIAYVRSLPMEASPMTISDSHAPKVPVVHLLGSTDNSVALRVEHENLRIVTGKKLLVIEKDIPTSIHTPKTSETPPSLTIGPDCLLVGSSEGTSVYFANTAEASRIKYKRCFQSLQGALEAGYKLRE